MKEVLKVSIARVSFTLERDAYRDLEHYLNNLRNYYKAETGKEEILEDIEERVAELIIERGGKDRVVTLEDIAAIIDILGKPYESENSFEGDGSPSQEKVRRSLYRDPSNAVIGGVCSGFAAYLKMDVVWVRILFILFFVLTATPLFALRHFLGLHIGGFAFMILVYCILWLIIPPARTVAQKCAMHGESLSVDEIQRKFNEGARNMGNEVRDFGRRTGSGAGRAIGRAIMFVMGGCLIAIGLTGIISGWFIFLGIDIISGINLMNIIEYIHLNIGSTFWIKMTGILVYFLPFIGMLYAGINLCFGFKGPKWKPGLLIFILWIISLLAFISLTVVAFRPYYRHQEMTQNLPIVKNYDTLYVKYAPTANCDRSRMYIDASRNNLKLFYLNRTADKEMEFITYPSLRIYRHSAKKSDKEPGKQSQWIECDVNYFTNFSIFDPGANISRAEDVVNIKDSLITVTPRVFSKQNKFGGDYESLSLFVPQNTVVILQEPVEHVFDGKRYSTGFRRGRWF